MAMKQNNFYLRWQAQAKAGQAAKRQQTMRWVGPAVGLVAVCMVGWGALALHTAALNSQTAAITEWCSDESNLTPYAQSVSDQNRADGYRSLSNYASGMNDLLASYPDVTSTLLSRIESAGGAGISTEFRSYDASSGALLFDAVSADVIDIPNYVRALEACGVFDSVTYTGYSADADEGYTVNLRCILAAPQEVTAQ